MTAAPEDGKKCDFQNIVCDICLRQWVAFRIVVILSLRRVAYHKVVPKLRLVKLMECGCWKDRHVHGKIILKCALGV